jgi:hypothetical protein
MGKSSGLVGIPCAEQGRYSAFWASVTGLTLPEGWSIFQGQGHSVASNRNGIIREAFKRGVEWVCFLDDDLLVPTDFLQTLLSTDREAVVGLSYFRQSPFQPLWFHTFGTSGDLAVKREDVPGPGTLYPLAWATAGGVLVSTRVLKLMDDPWFTLGQHGADQWNDDLDFFLKLAATGTQLYGCSSARCGHMSSMDVWPTWNADAGQWGTTLARGHATFATFLDAEKEPVCVPK